jgi:hypothetical protein
MSGGAVRNDLLENHGRKLSEDYIQKVAQGLGQQVELAQSRWTYALPEQVLQKTRTVGIGRDGTTMHIRASGYRETMSGTISFYDDQGERLHTIYRAQAPEYGKQSFNESFADLIEEVKANLGQAKQAVKYVGIADGAVDNWTFLDTHVEHRVLDYWHGAEYLTLASKAASHSQHEQSEWSKAARSDLKYGVGAVDDLLDQMNVFKNKRKLSTTTTEGLERAITYFENHKHQMDYETYQKLGIPIGSGVTEAACKVVVKQRMCCSGMKWHIDSAQNVLNLRAIILSKGQWNQFWHNIDQFGFSSN